MTPNPQRALSARPIPDPCVECGDHSTPILREDGVCLQCSAWMHLLTARHEFEQLKAFKESKKSDHA